MSSTIDSREAAREALLRLLVERIVKDWFSEQESTGTLAGDTTTTDVKGESESPSAPLSERPPAD
jgi:hypothetical protein